MGIISDRLSSDRTIRKPWFELSVWFCIFKLCCAILHMGDEKKKETKIEKKDEFGDTVEKTEIEEKVEDDWPKSSNFFVCQKCQKARTSVMVQFNCWGEKHARTFYIPKY